MQMNLIKKPNPCDLLHNPPLRTEEAVDELFQQPDEPGEPTNECHMNFWRLQTISFQLV